MEITRNQEKEKEFLQVTKMAKKEVSVAKAEVYENMHKELETPLG